MTRRYRPDMKTEIDDTELHRYCKEATGVQKEFMENFFYSCRLDNWLDNLHNYIRDMWQMETLGQIKKEDETMLLDAFFDITENIDDSILEKKVKRTAEIEIGFIFLPIN